MNTQRIQKILKGAEWPAVILAGIVAFAAIAYAAFSVGHLFSVYVKISPLESGLAVVSSVGMAVGLLLVIVTTDNQNARGLGSILLIAWVLLVLSMVALDSVMRAALVQSPAALQQIGRIVAALLPALALAGVVGMVIALHDKTTHKSAAGASSRYVSFAAKGVSIGASSFAAFYFGSSRGIDPVLAVLCAALLESSFLWSYLALKNSRDRGDRFDVGMWSVCVFLFGAFITLVSIETLSSLGRIEVPIVAAFGEIGATLYVSAVGLTVALTVIVHLLTRAIDDMPKQTDGTPFAIRTADTIRKTRAGMGEIKSALREPAKANPALPAGTPLTMADDGVNDGWTMHQNKDVLWFDKQFSNGTSAKVRSATGEPNASWEVWSTQFDAPIAQGEAGAIGLAKADAERAALAYKPTDAPLTPAQKATILAAMLAENRALMEDVKAGKKVSENGTAYDTTGFEVPPDEAAELMRAHREMLDREAQRPK